MGKFCTQCGRPLEEGQICVCQQQNNVAPGFEMNGDNTAPQTQNVEEQVAAQNQIQTENQTTQFTQEAQQSMQGVQYQQAQNQQGPQYQQVQYQQGAPYQQAQNQQGPQYQQAQYQQAAQGTNQQYQQTRQQYQQVQQKVQKHMQLSFGMVLNLIKHPVSAGRAFINNAEMSIVATLIILQGIMSALFALVSMKKIGSMIVSFGKAMSGYGSNYETNAIKFPYGKIFFITLLLSCVLSIVLAGLLVLANKIIKNQVSFQNMLAVVAVRSTLIAASTLVAIILFFIKPSIGADFFYLGSVLGFIEIAMIMPVTSREISDKLPIALFLVAVLFFAIMAFIMYKSWPSFLPDNMKDAYNEIKPYLSNPSELLNEMFR